MNWTTEELGFILYNNRSVDGVVKNFIPKKINPFKLTKIEQILKSSKSKFQSDDRMVEVNINEINQKSNDIKVTPEDLKELSEDFYLKVGQFSQPEIHFLFDRGVDQEVMWKWQLFGLSQITDKRHLEIIGATVHPTMSKFLEDAIESGGIVIPLFDENDNLINCAVRKVGLESNGSTRTLKYTLACPDVPVWGLDKIEEGDEFWITEGIFDTMAIYELGEKSVSCSSAMWSGIQLYQLLEKKPKMIKFFSDNDEVGLRTSAILSDFFNQYDIETKIFISEDYKDASELYFLKKMDLSALKEIEVTDDMINLNKDNSFNFIEHLKNRKF
jgi:hypothetical protein